jgi:hypothetical protein
MRPEWFNCGGCLFYLPSAEICEYHPMPVEKAPTGYCSFYTCRCCWRRWDFMEAAGQWIDHQKCGPCKFTPEG